MAWSCNDTACASARIASACGGLLHQPPPPRALLELLRTASSLSAANATEWWWKQAQRWAETNTSAAPLLHQTAKSCDLSGEAQAHRERCSRMLPPRWAMLLSDDTHNRAWMERSFPEWLRRPGFTLWPCSGHDWAPACVAVDYLAASPCRHHRAQAGLVRRLRHAHQAR